MVHKYLKNIVTLKLDDEKCIKCGICVQVCPHRVFRKEADKIAVIERDRCIECGACAKNCPASAIAVSSGVG